MIIGEIILPRKKPSLIQYFFGVDKNLSKKIDIIKVEKKIPKNIILKKLSSKKKKITKKINANIKPKALFVFRKDIIL